MIILRRNTCVQTMQNGTNLLLLSINSIYEQIHNTFLIGWVLGILLLVFSLIILLKLTAITSKRVLSLPSLEMLWLFFPGFILVSIAIPTLLRLYHLDQQRLRPSYTLKTIGRQWYWSYELADSRSNFEDDIRVNSYIDLTNNDRLNYLSRDQELKLSYNTDILNLISATDVMHC